MVVLNRGFGEEIHIGDDITITVLVSENGRINIGIDAPDELGVGDDEPLALITGATTGEIMPENNENVFVAPVIFCPVHGVSTVACEHGEASNSEPSEIEQAG